MNTKAELEQNIIQITMKIDKEFPELSKYLKEIPFKATHKDKEVISIENLKEYYDSLMEMLGEYAKTHKGIDVKQIKEMVDFPGYPLYPPADDIYQRDKLASNVKLNDTSKTKVPNEEPGTMNEKDFKEDMSGDDLDVPGSELDDQMESVGSEDEENNYYSLGGDNHNNLEEDQG